MDSDAGLLSRLALRDLECPVRAAVVDNNILPELIGLSDNALNTLTKVFLPVVDGRHNANQRFFTRDHSDLPRGNARI